MRRHVMSTKTMVRAIALTMAVALAVVAINLEACIAPPVLSAETGTIAVPGSLEEDVEAASYPIELPVNPQRCPC
jgi:hypothetical protein